MKSFYIFNFVIACVYDMESDVDNYMRNDMDNII